MSDKISSKLKYGLTTGLVIVSAIFSLSLCLFAFGYYLTNSAIPEFKSMGLLLIVISFASGIFSSAGISIFKKKLNLMIDYGNPLIAASEHIKDIIKQVNIFGVDHLQDIIERVIKEEIKKIAKKEKNKE